MPRAGDIQTIRQNCRAVSLNFSFRERNEKLSLARANFGGLVALSAFSLEILSLILVRQYFNY